MRLGLHSFSYHLHLEDVDCSRDVFWFLRRVQSLGLHGCEIDSRHLQGWDPALLRDVGHFCREHGLYLDLGAYGFDFDRISQRLDLAGRSGARLLRTLISPEARVLDDAGRQALVDRSLVSFHKLSKVAEDCQVILAIENDGTVPSDDLLSIVREINSPWFRTCIDIGNAAVLWEDPVKVAEKLVPFAASIHLKDWQYSWDRGVSRRKGCALMEGDVAVEAIYSLIRRSSPKTPVTIEVATVGPEGSVCLLAEEELNVKQSVERVVRLEEQICRNSD